MTDDAMLEEQLQRIADRLQAIGLILYRRTPSDLFSTAEREWIEGEVIP